MDHVLKPDMEVPFVRVQSSSVGDAPEKSVNFWGSGMSLISVNDVAEKPVFGTRITEFVNTLKNW